MSMVRIVVLFLVMCIGVSFGGTSAYAHPIAGQHVKDNCKQHHARHAYKCCITCGASIAAFPDISVLYMPESRGQRFKYAKVNQTIVPSTLQAQYRPPKVFS